MDERGSAYLAEYSEKIISTFKESRKSIYESAPLRARETLRAKLLSSHVGESFARLIPFKGHIHIETRGTGVHKEELTGYTVTPKGMLPLPAAGGNP